MAEHASILVVDDEEILRNLLRDVLTLDGFDVETARSGEEALSVMEARGIDLVICDNNMPGMQGLDLLAEVRRNDTILPVIIMTAYGSIEVSMRAHDLGASGYLLKPFDDIEVVAKEVRRALDRADKERRLKGASGAPNT